MHKNICIKYLLYFTISYHEINSKLFKFWAAKKSYMDFQQCWGSVPLTPELFKGQL